MIEHLHEVHKIGKEGPIPLEQGQVLIETVFGKTQPQVTRKYGSLPRSPTMDY